MPNSFFQFKQFTVWHDRCAMKVGTDGVLLGAWAQTENADTILDIGTGSGLIALMLAQRYPHSCITGIDIDDAAVSQANENFKASPWSSQLKALSRSLEQFSIEHDDTFDAIVSNPPFFEQSLKSPDQHRTTARHTTDLSFEALLQHSFRLLTDNGKLHLILPVLQAEALQKTLPTYPFFCEKKTYVQPKPQSPPKRLLLSLSKKPCELQQDTLTIEDGTRHHYTEAYIELTRNFYLKM